MKCAWLLVILFFITGSYLSAMDYDDDFDEETIEFFQDLPVVKIWALPEVDTPAQQQFIYSATDPIHHIVENGTYHHLLSRLKGLTANEINQPDAQRNTPLHIAARILSYRKVDLLLQNGALPDVLNAHNDTPADLMPVAHINPLDPLASLTQPQFAIQAMLQLASYNQPYIIDSEGNFSDDLCVLIQESLNGGN